MTEADKTNINDLVATAKESKKFSEDVSKQRQRNKDDKIQKDVPPVFNKRLFASQGTVILTSESRRIMRRNEENLENYAVRTLSKYEYLAMRSVVDGLKLVHKEQDFVKDVLCEVVTLERVDAFHYVDKRSYEDRLSCYYIVNGAVEVTYDLSPTDSRNVFQPNIVYSHGTGEYIGLVSVEGQSEDLAPPATIYTKEYTELLRIDRYKFHLLIRTITDSLRVQKRCYLESEGSVLSEIPEEAKDKIIDKMLRHEHPPNRVILQQHVESDWMFFILTGHCQCFREVFIPETEKTVKFYLASIEKGDFVGEECLLDKVPSSCTVITSTPTTFYKLHRSALDVVQRDQLANILESHRNEFPSDDELRDRGYYTSVWNKYKHQQIKDALVGEKKLRLLWNKYGTNVHLRPPDEDEQNGENLYRFENHGASYEKMRVRSAYPTRSRSRATLVPRPATVPANHTNSVISGSLDDDAKSEVSSNTSTNGDSKAGSSRPETRGVRRVRFTKSRPWAQEPVPDPPEVFNRVRTAWGAQEDQMRNEDIMRSRVLVAMKTEDIVRKAKAIAEKYAKKGATDDKDTSEEWHTIVHAEHKQARIMVVANKYRAEVLRRKMATLQKVREKEREKFRSSRQPKPKETKKEETKSTVRQSTREKIFEEIRKEQSETIPSRRWSMGDEKKKTTGQQSDNSEFKQKEFTARPATRPSSARPTESLYTTRRYNGRSASRSAIPQK